MSASRCVRLRVLVCSLTFSLVAYAIEPAVSPPPNSDPTYQQLRNLSLGGETISVNNLDLQRDASTFHLRSGTVCFIAPVQGRVTGAVFVGDGSMSLQPSQASERASLKLLTKEEEFNESFSHLVLRFTDGTYEELKKSGGTASGACDASLLRDSQNALRHGRVMKYNLDARILEDVLGSDPGGLFVAFIHGKRYNGKELYFIDPHGAPGVAPEQVELMTDDENKFGLWTAFYLGNQKETTLQQAVVRIEHQRLDTRIEKNANLQGKALTTFVAMRDGIRVIPFSLFPTLRVQSVTVEGGQPLAFIQEDKKDDADFRVIFPKALTKGEKLTIITIYGGKEAVINTGGGNYFPIAREDWYPNSANFTLGEYASYDMTFRIPKGMKIAATGDLVSEQNEGGENVSVWKSGRQPVAGFNFGKFRMQEAKLDKPEYLVQSYANEEPPDEITALLHMANGDLPHQGSHMEAGEALGNMSTLPLIKKALAEGQLSVQLYTDYFGPSAYKRLAITQQTACNYGQSWPELVWIPMCYFYDTTIRHQLGKDRGDRGYWKSVTSHEVAHQWWGHTVGFSSYRDQWMSEGFAEMSASLYLQLIEKNPQKFISFWNDQREMLLERDKEGWRAIDAGPLTLGYRTNNSRTGEFVTERLIYPKGAYILHMIRMMMWDHRTGDENFKATMHDFVRNYTNRAATTEDFKSMIEKHMTPEMDLEGNHKMDWFFNEYVYGTALPSYKFNYSFDKDPSGEVLFNLKVTQSNVNDKFRMLVPIYLELADGRMVNLGRARVSGNSSVEQKVPLKGLKDTPKRAMLSYYDDVLAVPN
jgi:Peptidase family M1 domain